MTKITALILLFIIQYIPGLISVVYKLEDDLHSSFDLESNLNMCDDDDTWVLDKEDTNDDSDSSDFYLRPLEVTSCVTFSFNITSDGYFRIELYAGSISTKDHVKIVVYEENFLAEMSVVAEYILLPSEKRNSNVSQVVILPAKSNCKKGYVCTLYNMYLFYKTQKT